MLAIARLPPRLPATPLPLTPANITCDCGDLCRTPTSQPAKELFGFGAGHWQNFDWSRVTT
eukprot:5043837-Prymnesium_polylepis.1